MSREQWGHGYYKGLHEGLQANVSFYDYAVMMHDGEDSILGDFVHDMKNDPWFPKSIGERTYRRYGETERRPYKSYKKCVIDHMRGEWQGLDPHPPYHACKEAVDAFKIIWREFISLGRKTNK